MRYLDTSLLVGALTEEPRNRELQAWLAAQQPGSLHVSWWTLTEFATATARQVRERTASASVMTAARGAFTVMTASMLLVHPVARSDFETAGRFAGRPDVNLRSSDALHLAVAAAHDFEVVTLDTRMAAGGAANGVATLLL